MLGPRAYKRVESENTVMKIYVASSWRNGYQQLVVNVLRSAGAEVYDFKNPREGDNGFHWSEIDPEWRSWTTEKFVAALDHPVAERGFKSDFDAMEWADVFVLVLPCGRSAHLELGWAAGNGKPTCVFSPEPMEPELMVKMCDKVTGEMTEVLRWLEEQGLQIQEPHKASSAL